MSYEQLRSVMNSIQRRNSSQAKPTIDKHTNFIIALFIAISLARLVKTAVNSPSSPTVCMKLSSSGHKLSS